jgi:hypothetical protein
MALVDNVAATALQFNPQIRFTEFRPSTGALEMFARAQDDENRLLQGMAGSTLAEIGGMQRQRQADKAAMERLEYEAMEEKKSNRRSILSRMAGNVLGMGPQQVDKTTPNDLLGMLNQTYGLLRTGSDARSAVAGNMVAPMSGLAAALRGLGAS